jgi:3-oxoacyl-[acyl-carrier protein] reductase
VNTLQNKTALVTGASKGIGRATALALAKAGAHVVVHYGRSAQEAESLVAEIQTNGGRADAISADLGTPDGASLLAKQVRSIVGDRLDVLVLNAGVSKAARVADHTVADFDNLVATNVRGPFFLVQQLLPVLGEGSNIVAISSAVTRTVVGKPGLEDPSVLLTPPPKAHLRRWSGTGPPFWGRAAYASTLSRQASSTRICRILRRQKRDGSWRWACRL